MIHINRQAIVKLLNHSKSGEFSSLLLLLLCIHTIDRPMNVDNTNENETRYFDCERKSLITVNHRFFLSSAILACSPLSPQSIWVEDNKLQIIKCIAYWAWALAYYCWVSIFLFRLKKSKHVKKKSKLKLNLLWHSFFSFLYITFAIYLLFFTVLYLRRRQASSMDKTRHKQKNQKRFHLTQLSEDKFHFISH